MLRLEARPEPSRAMSIASPLIALAITVVIGTCLFLLLGKDPLRGLAVFFVEPVRSVYALTELAVKATPLLIIALGLLGFGMIGAGRCMVLETADRPRRRR